MKLIGGTMSEAVK
jgi:hypothetical protein